MFLEQWQALSGRIRGLVQAWQLSTSGNAFGGLIATKFLHQGLKILADLEVFSKSFGNSLPPSAIDAIENCVSKDDHSPGMLLGPHTTGSPPNLWQEQVGTALILLAAFETEMTFILSDTQAVIRARSERAFEHLRRLIVVDASTRSHWKAALKEGETSCEKLGAVHLLWHGIFAFKVDAAGGRTDLVFPERPVDGLGEQRYADGFVLTEWKVVRSRSDDEARRKFAEARDQARRYTHGVLAGVELTTVRYAVVVSLEQITEPDDEPDGAVIYRHINVAVDPETPSKGSRRARSNRHDGRPPTMT
jgi:hypothetical protein